MVATERLGRATGRVEASGKSPKASGVFHISLERLAEFYGMVDAKRLAAIGNDKAFGRGVRAVLDFVGIAFTAVPGTDRDAVEQFVAGLRKRFGNCV